MSVAATVCLFQFDRTSERGDWACYDWSDYKNVPSTWKQTRNQVSLYGSTSTIDYKKRLVTDDVHRVRLIVKSIARTVSIKPDDK